MPSCPYLILRYALVLTLVNHPLILQTPVLMPPVVQLISLYTVLCSKKMPRGHVSPNSSTPPPPAQCASPPPPQQQRIVFFLHQLPGFARHPPPYFLFGALGVRRQPATVSISAWTKWLQRLALTCGNVPCRVPAYKADTSKVNNRPCVIRHQSRFFRTQASTTSLFSSMGRY